jgi:hypothetical protein
MASDKGDELADRLAPRTEVEPEVTVAAGAVERLVVLAQLGEFET